MKFKLLVRSLRAAMIQSAELALLLDKIKTFCQVYKIFLKLEQAWARLKISASLLRSIEQSSDIFFLLRSNLVQLRFNFHCSS